MWKEGKEGRSGDNRGVRKKGRGKREEVGGDKRRTRKEEETNREEGRSVWR